MGLTEAVKALISVKADASQAKSEFKSLRGVERDAARERMAEAEAANKAVDKTIAMYAKAAAAIGVATGAVVIAKKAWNSYIEDVRLESAAAGSNLDGLKKATHGLVEADNLLAFAGKAMHGTWKLNQEEMERVLHGAMALRKTMGVELQPTIEALTESIQKGNTRALKEFGIEAKDKAGVLRELDGLYQGLGGNVALAGDEMAKTGVEMTDAFDDMVGALGKFVNELTPAVKVLAEFVGLLARAGELSDKIAGVDTQGGSAYDQRMRGVAELRKEAEYYRERAALGPFWANKADELERQARQAEQFASKAGRNSDVRAANKAFDQLAKESLQAVVDENVKRANEAFERLAKDASDRSKRGRRARSGRGGGDYAGRPIDFDLGSGYLETAEGIGRGLVAGGKAAYQKWSESDERRRFAEDDNSINEFNDKFEAEQKKAEKLQESYDDLTRVLGVTPEFDAHTEAINAMADAYGVLGNAAGDAYEALVTGSEDATTAMKRALANGLLAMGRDFFVRALGETAMGLGSLALGPIGGASAAQHFAAAGAFGAAAAAAGVAARALGAGGGGGGGGGAGARGGGGGRAMPTGVGGGGGGEVNRHVTVILGGEFDNMTPAERQMRFARAVKAGMNAGSSTTIRDG